MAENNSSAPLLPCPFCGAAARLKPSTRGNYTSIVCNSPCAGPLAIVVPNDQIEAGVAAWNTRAPLKTAGEPFVALGECIADQVCLSVAELPDRDSPADWPQAMLVTSDELRNIVLNAINYAAQAVEAQAPTGNWINADDVSRLVRALDVALHGEDEAAPQASLCDVVGLVKEAARKLGRPVLAAQAAPASVAVPDERWCPDVCPITGREFFMWVTHHESGDDVPTYGGPFDSYTIPTQDKDGSFSCERYDHDFGGWKDWENVGLMLVDDQSFVVAPDNPRYYEIEQFATPALPATEDSSAGDLAAPNDAEIIALNDGERFFSMSESRFGKEVNPHTQYHTGEPGYLQFARAVLARWGSAPQAQPAFQQRVQPWMMECFGVEHAADHKKRNQHFLEEALELVQSTGWTQSEAHQLVDYVYGRPWGEPAQEVGGVMVTLAALCLANGLDMHQAGESELARIWSNVDNIRARQAAKPSFSPLPQAQPADALEPIRQAVRDYHYALDTDSSCGVAAGAALDSIQTMLDMCWRPGQERSRRAAMAAAQEGGKAAKEA